MIITDYLDDNSADDEGPLTEQERQQYEAHELHLPRDLPMSALLTRLSSLGCISGEHVAAIAQCDTELQQVVALLDIMARRSLTQYRLFLNALRRADEETSVKRQLKTDNFASIIDALVAQDKRNYYFLGDYFLGVIF